MIIPQNTLSTEHMLNWVEKLRLDFIPVCDFFEHSDRLFLPGSRTVQLDFSQVQEQ